MQPTRVLRATLFLSGAIAATIGAALLIDPVAFHASNGSQLHDNPNLLSEVRAPAGALFLVGVFGLAATFRSRWAHPAARTLSAVYLSYAFARLVSLVVDGLPGPGLLAATGIELVLGCACLWAVRRDQRTSLAGRPRMIAGMA